MPKREQNPLVGRTIAEVRPMKAKEFEALGWSKGRYPPDLYVLDDGTLLIPSRDSEGNGPGCIFVEEGSKPRGA